MSVPPKATAPAPTLSQAMASPPPAPNLSSFMDEFFALAGGTRNIAKMLWDEFRTAPQGSQIRARVLEAVLRGLKGADANRPGTDDLGHLSAEDLERDLARRLGLLQAKSETTHAPPAGGPPAPEPQADQPQVAGRDPGHAGLGGTAPAAGA